MLIRMSTCTDMCSENNLQCLLDIATYHKENHTGDGLSDE